MLNGYITMKITHIQKIPRRSVCNHHEFILDKCKGKSVLHVGACDHPQNVKSKYANRTLLHSLINETASHTVGIDINNEAISECQAVGINNIYKYNILNESEYNPSVDGITYDVCVVGGTLQHVGNAELFLASLKKLLTPDTKVLINAPNAFWIKNLFSLFYSVEFCNSDQWCYYSPTTLRRTLEGAGYNFEDFIWHGKGRSDAPLSLKARIKENILWKAFPHLANGLIATASLSS